eukprot:3935653-Alexandrium_andersonii.AAC.1
MPGGEQAAPLPQPARQEAERPALAEAEFERRRRASGMTQREIAIDMASLAPERFREVLQGFAESLRAKDVWKFANAKSGFS